MFVWGRSPDHAPEATLVIDAILNTTNVFITPGSIFGPAGERYMRLSLCSPAGVLTAAMEALQQAAALYTEIGLTTQAASARTALADVIEQAGRTEEALALSAAIIESAPDETWLRRNYANAVTKLKRLLGMKA